MSKRQTTSSQQEAYDRKAAGRRARAALPVEEKIEILVKLQEMNASVARVAGRDFKQPWNIKPSKRTET